MLSQKLFTDCQVKQQHIKIPNPRTIHHSNPNRYQNNISTVLVSNLLRAPCRNISQRQESLIIRKYLSTKIPFISHHRACLLHTLQTPNSRKSLYLPNIPNSPLNRYGTMITNTCWSRNVRKNKIKSNINLPNFPISCQEISATCIVQIKNNQPFKKISHPKP